MCKHSKLTCCGFRLQGVKPLQITFKRLVQCEFLPNRSSTWVLMDGIRVALIRVTWPVVLWPLHVLPKWHQARKSLGERGGDGRFGCHGAAGGGEGRQPSRTPPIWVSMCIHKETSLKIKTMAVWLTFWAISSLTSLKIKTTALWLTFLSPASDLNLPPITLSCFLTSLQKKKDINCGWWQRYQLLSLALDLSLIKHSPSHSSLQTGSQ